jgi:septal ring factor EnvC (AmiA/AmiB activator)
MAIGAEMDERRTTTPTPRSDRRGPAGPIVRALVAAFLLLAPPSLAEETAATAKGPDAARAELEAIRHEVEVGRDRQAEIRREIEALDRDRTRIGERLVESAARARTLEQSLSAGEARIDDLARRATTVRASLAERRGVLAEVLAALQRIGRKPPPAILVRPEDARAAVRSAILVGALLPELRVEAERLAADLGALDELRTAAIGERDRYRAEAADLAQERTRLAALIEERRRTRSDREKNLAEAEQATEELARKAGSLEDLIGRLTKESGSRPPPSSADRQASLDEASRLQPTIAFAEARGRLPLPVGGAIRQRFGEDDGLGGTARGVTFSARPEAVVSSPSDGRVVFLGPFRSYGKLLIINAGGGYHVLLAGLARIDVEAGQFVLAGEPVGVMGGPAVPGTSGAGTDHPSLYVEFRKDNTSIDPSPWWAGPRDEKVRG